MKGAKRDSSSGWGCNVEEYGEVLDAAGENIAAAGRAGHAEGQ